MATVITAGNATNGLSFTPDNTGALDIKTGTGAGTTALTLTSSQIATFAGAASVPGNLSFNSGYGSSAVAYGCRAWVNFNGTGTPAIRAQGNVSSITDNGTGDYTIVFTTAMPDANYAISIAGQRNATGTGDELWVMIRNDTSYTSLTTASARIIFNQSGGSLEDPLVCCASIFR